MIHIVGAGSVGLFIAHALRSTSQPVNTTLILHRPGAIAAWFRAKGRIKLEHLNAEETSEGCEVEYSSNLPSDEHGQVMPEDDSMAQYTKYDHISYLIVAVKAHHTLAALEPLLHRLDSRSTILLLQNGMGTYEEVTSKFWPDPQDRPNFVLGINSHGLHTTARYAIKHAGRGILTFGLVPRIPPTETPSSDTRSPKDPRYEEWPESARWLTQTLTRIPLLAAVAVHPIELKQLQLEKLAVNCVINPVTCLLDGRNESILKNQAITRVQRLLLAEISAVICSMPELKNLPVLEHRFAPSRLEQLTIQIAMLTGTNISSMLQDMRRGAETEIDYINGYIVKRGEECGFKPVINYMVWQLVKGKQAMVSREVDDYVPLRDVPNSERRGRESLL